MKDPEVSIAIPTCNGRALLAECLEALGAVTFPRDRLEVLVYDNASTDETRPWLARAFPEVRVLESETNQGFAAPCNRLAEVARAPWVFFLNNDVRVEPDALALLVDAAAASNAAVVGARVLSADGRRIEFDGGTMSFLGHGAPYRNGELAAQHAAEDAIRETLFSTGAAMLVNREIFLGCGGFDEDYFAYYEDVDLGWRLWMLGERCLHAPAARVRHREHGSESVLPAGRRLALLERNALLSVVKNYEEPRAARALRCGLALLAERERLAPDAGRRRACREALLSAAPLLPAAERRASALRPRRRRADAEYAHLFVDPWRPPIPGDLYARRQAEIAAVFGAADLFRAPNLDPHHPSSESPCP